MHLALLCFFSEADAIERAREAGREARELFRAEHESERIQRPKRDVEDEVPELLQRIGTMVDPVEIRKAIYKWENHAYSNQYKKARSHAENQGASEATHFSISLSFMNASWS